MFTRNTSSNRTVIGRRPPSHIFVPGTIVFVHVSEASQLTLFGRGSTGRGEAYYDGVGENTPPVVDGSDAGCGSFAPIHFPNDPVDAPPVQNRPVSHRKILDRVIDYTTSHNTTGSQP
jgi:hypothetical protein